MILLNMADFQGRKCLFLVIKQPRNNRYLVIFQGKISVFLVKFQGKKYFHQSVNMQMSICGFIFRSIKTAANRHLRFCGHHLEAGDPLLLFNQGWS
jgi:hypothetical protein